MATDTLVIKHQTISILNFEYALHFTNCIEIVICSKQHHKIKSDAEKWPIYFSVIHSSIAFWVKLFL